MEQIVQICTACGRTFHAKSRCVYCPQCRQTRKTVRDRITLEEYPCGDLAHARRREDGVLVLPPVLPKASVRGPRKPPKGTRPDSLEAVLYRLEIDNGIRAKRGQKPLSYGQYVAMEELEKHRKD